MNSNRLIILLLLLFAPCTLQAQTGTGADVLIQAQTAKADADLLDVIGVLEQAAALSKVSNGERILRNTLLLFPVLKPRIRTVQELQSILQPCALRSWVIETIDKPIRAYHKGIGAAMVLKDYLKGY